MNINKSDFYCFLFPPYGGWTPVISLEAAVGSLLEKQGSCLVELSNKHPHGLHSTELLLRLLNLPCAPSVFL